MTVLPVFGLRVVRAQENGDDIRLGGGGLLNALRVIPKGNRAPLEHRGAVRALLLHDIFRTQQGAQHGRIGSAGEIRGSHPVGDAVAIADHL